MLKRQQQLLVVYHSEPLPTCMRAKTQWTNERFRCLFTATRLSVDDAVFVSDAMPRNVPPGLGARYGPNDGPNVAHRYGRRDRQHVIGGSAAVDRCRPRSGGAVRVARSLSCADRRQSPLLRLGSQRRPSVAQCTSAITVSCAVRADVGRRALRTETE